MKKLIVLFLLIPVFWNCGEDKDEIEPVEDHPIVGIWQLLSEKDTYIRLDKGSKIYYCSEYGIKVDKFYNDFTVQESTYRIKENDKIHIVATVRYKDTGLIEDLSTEGKYTILDHHPDNISIKGAFLITEFIYDSGKETTYYKKVK